jgi:hypothetical protein
MIDIYKIHQFLLHKNLITNHEIVHGDLDIHSVTRRNRNLKITTRDRGGFLLKQPASSDEAALITLRREASFYALCHGSEEYARVRALLPRLVLEDHTMGLLVLELVQGAQPLWRYYRDRATDRFPVELAGRIGELIGLFHESFSATTMRREGADFLTDKPPWAFDLHRPAPEKLATISRGQYELIKALQDDPSYAREADHLRRDWQANCVVHGDVKMDNFLVLEAERELPSIFLIDWEFVQLGDAAWDVGGAFQDFIFWWVLGMPQIGEIEAMVAGAKYPLATLQPGIRALWAGYSATRGFDADQSEAFLLTSLRMAALRMVQTAAEISSRFQYIPLPAVLLSQVAVNLLKDPDSGRTTLFGLSGKDA